MAWVRIDDQAPRNAKLLKAGPAAAWMWVCGIAYCQAHMTDGFIPDIAVSMCGVRGAERSQRLAKVLVDCGLFDRISDSERVGFMVHDYLDFNETREQALARKEKLAKERSDSGRVGGIQSGISRRSNEANRKQSLEAKRSPDPTRPDRTKNPPTPFARGRRRKRRDGVGGSVCAHEPTCASYAECRDRILAESKAS